MTYHEWGDDFDFDAVSNAAHDLYDYCKKWGRVGLHVKEKYGTLRAYTTCAFFGNGYPMLHSLLYPGHAYYRYKYKWFTRFDMNYLGPAINFCFGHLIHWWQKRVYNKGYQLILKKYPHIREEILCDADYPELIDGAEKYRRKYE